MATYMASAFKDNILIIIQNKGSQPPSPVVYKTLGDRIGIPPIYPTLKLGGKIMTNYCDNTDCVSSTDSLTLEVELRDEFDHDRIYWCMDCIKRDKDMIKKVISENE